MNLNPHDILGLNTCILILKINFMYKDWADLIHVNDLGVSVDIKAPERKQ